MAIRKANVVTYEGLDSGQIGDVLYWDGSSWVRLNPSDNGKRLITHGTVSGPSWEWIIYNGAVVWYSPGGSWHIGPHVGGIWYRTTDYSGTDPSGAVTGSATWESASASYDPVPTISYDSLGDTFSISGAGVSLANDTYEAKGTNYGVSVYGNPAYILGTP